MPALPPDPAPHPDDEAPPLGSWGRLYALVLGMLGLEIVVFYLFTVFFTDGFR